MMVMLRKPHHLHYHHHLQLLSEAIGSNNNIQKQQLPSKTHEYTLIAQDTTVEIAPGVRVDAWTYNGTIPGPTLRATEGDRVVIHFINKTPLPHTVHLHGDHPSGKMVCLNKYRRMGHTLMISLQHQLVH